MREEIIKSARYLVVYSIRRDLHITRLERVCGFMGTCTNFLCPQVFTRWVQLHNCIHTHEHKIVPVPSTYRVFTRGHAGNLYPLPSLPRSCLVQKNYKINTLALSFVFWQILFNHGLTRLKRFVSQITGKLCN